MCTYRAEHTISTAYHATQREETKQFIAHSFSRTSGEMRCVCSTTAFGMVSNSTIMHAQ